MLPLMGAALSGGLSLLSGLGSQRSAKSQQRRQQAMDEENRRYNQYVTDLANSHNEALGRELANVPVTTQNRSRVDVETMMMDAQRAGFNPVTWLQSGALQAYTQTENTVFGANAAEGFRMMMHTPALSTASQAVNIPNALSVIGDAGQAALKSYQTDDRLLQSQAFQERMLGVKLSQLQQAGRSSGMMFGSVPAYGTSGSYTTRGGMTGTSSALTDRTPQEVTPTLNGYSEPGPNPIIQYFDAGHGSWMIGQSTKYKESSEDDVLATLSWNVANRFLPMVGLNYKPPPDMLYGTERWVYNPLYQTYDKVSGPRASMDSFDVKVTPVPKDTPNGLSINGYQIWPFWK